MKSPQLPTHSLILVPNTIPSTLFSTHSVLMKGQCKRLGLKDNIKFHHTKMDLKMQAGSKLRSNDEHTMLSFIKTVSIEIRCGFKTAEVW